MRFLLDTNVISEIRKPSHVADVRVRAWFAAQPVANLALSVVTVMELEIEVLRMERREAHQGARLRRWYDEVLAAFGPRILGVDLSVARRAARRHVPDPGPDRDALIAATADEHGLTVVTRNTRDFGSVPVLDPWG